VCRIMEHSRFHGRCKPAKDKDFKVNNLTREIYEHSDLVTNLEDLIFPAKI
jgi:hypothetical protein